MNTKAAIIVVLLISVLVVGCGESKTNGYSTYNQPQQQQAVGGGCGVAPSGAYENTPIGALDSKDTAL